MLKIPLIKPYIPDKTLTAVRDVLFSGYLTEGLVTKKFEEHFARFIHIPHAIAVTSCTTGLELVLRALDIGTGDEIIIPDYTYPATAQSIMITGATAVIVDCDPNTLNIDYNALEAAITPRTKCIMPVSLFGNPLNWDILNRLASRYKLKIVEDAACAFGSSYKGCYSGAFGDAAVFSLHPRKSITTGEGGMITTHDDILAARLRSLKHFGLTGDTAHRENILFAYLGTNAKMSDIVAAVGLAQLDEAEHILACRRNRAERYQLLLADMEQAGHLRWPITSPESLHGWQSCCILVSKRDRILQSMRSEDIEVQIGTYALHREPLFQSHPLCRLHGSLSGSLKAYETTLALPLYHTMTDADQEYVVDRLIANFNNFCSKTGD